MLEIIRKFFRFCDARERREFYCSIVLGVLAALFSALKLPAIGVMLQAILTGGVTGKTILLSLTIMLVSVVGSSLLKYRATALQADGGYRTTANKRVQIAEHLRYLPMGYFNENGLGAITSVTTNTMDNLSGVSTRVVMLVTEGVFSTVVLSLALYTGGHMTLLNCVMLCICSFLLTEGLEQAGTQSSLLRVVDTCVEQANGILNLPAMDISGAELKPEHHDLRAENIRFSYDKKAHHQRHHAGYSGENHHRHCRAIRRRKDYPLPPAVPLLGCGRRARHAGRP